MTFKCPLVGTCSSSVAMESKKFEDFIIRFGYSTILKTLNCKA